MCFSWKSRTRIWTNKRTKKRISKIACERSLSVAMVMGELCIVCWLLPEWATNLVLLHSPFPFPPHSELSKDTTIFLRFSNKDLEEAYVKHREPMSSVPLVASLLVHLVGSVYSSIILPSSIIHFVIIFAPAILIILFAFISIAESFPNVNIARALLWIRFGQMGHVISLFPFQIFSERVIKFSKGFNDISPLRRLAAILTVFVVGASNLFDMVSVKAVASSILDKQ